MIQASVVAEGRTDAQLLKRLLPPELSEQVEFIIGGGSYGAQSLAGSILAAQRRPVVLVLTRLLGEDFHSLYSKLDDEAVRVLREHPLIVELIRFLTQVVAQPT